VISKSIYWPALPKRSDNQTADNVGLVAMVCEGAALVTGTRPLVVRPGTPGTAFTLGDIKQEQGIGGVMVRHRGKLASDGDSGESMADFSHWFRLLSDAPPVLIAPPPPPTHRLM
jgi:hypothetical protein